MVSHNNNFDNLPWVIIIIIIIMLLSMICLNLTTTSSLNERNYW